MLPRIQGKLIALVLIVISLYILTTQLRSSSDLPSNFLSSVAGKDKPSSTKPSSAVPNPAIDEKPLPLSSDILQPGSNKPEDPKASAQPQAPSDREAPAGAELPSKPDPPAKPEASSEPDGPSKPHSDTKSDSKHEASPKEPEPSKATILSAESTTSRAAAPTASPELNPGAVKSDVTLEARIAFWRKFEKLLAASNPDCEPPSRLGTAKTQGFSATKELHRDDVLSMPEKDVEKMKQAHRKMMEGLKESMPELPYTVGTRGLVSTAGGKYLPVFVVSLRMLRRSGTSLPMEVFLADENEYEQEICDRVLPTLNARCVVLSKVLTAVPHSIEIDHYQYKVFAMLFSSFEDILFLDSDAWPIRDAEQLFTSEPFISAGMVTWPDFWASSASPFFYKISGQEVPKMNLRQSTESGELLLAKRTHSKSLLLATYYNYYGKQYYPLFSQGAPGEGDKETFVAAASALGEPFYQTSEPVRPIGHSRQSDEKFTGTAMVQYDPIEDHRLTSQDMWRVKDEKAAKAPRPFFLHCNFPRYNPVDVFDHPEHTKAQNGSYQRTWTGGESILESFDYDIEKDMWEEVRWVSCELEHSFKSMKGVDSICAKATAYYEGMYLHDVPTSKKDQTGLENSTLKNEQTGSPTAEEKPAPKAESKAAPPIDQKTDTEKKPTGFKSKPPGPGA